MMKIRRLSVLCAVVVFAISLTACTKKDVIEEPNYAVDGIEDAEISVSTEDQTVTEGEADNGEWDFVNERPSDIAEDETVAAKAVARFETEVLNASSLQALAESIKSDSDTFPVDLDIVPVSEGFLNGFNKNITGFTEGYMIAPFVSSIPFVSYVFTTDDVDGLVKQLEESADLRWNICTMADELKITSSDNTVFIIMAPWVF